MNASALRVLLVTENASEVFGGEAARPLSYFRYLHEHGVDVRMLVHARCRAGLAESLPHLMDRIHFVENSRLQVLLGRSGRCLPEEVRSLTSKPLIHLVTQVRQRRLARRLVARYAIQIVHEPIPISPKQPSLMHGLGVPVVIGPMNGDMDYPPAFRDRQSRLTQSVLRLVRALAGPLNRLMPGKRRAAVLLVSNERTRRALPRGCRGRVVPLVANAVDTSLWRAPDRSRRTGPPTFVFLGRLTGFKGVDLLLEAFQRIAEGTDARLEIIGDGTEGAALKERAERLGIAPRVRFSGWLRHERAVRRLSEADVFVFPSLLEPGGAVIMEAMCLGLAVIAADWGGPADYLAAGAGVLVPPTSREALIAGFADAMRDLAADPALRRRMSDAALKHIPELDWNRRVERLIEIYRETIAAEEEKRSRP